MDFSGVDIGELTRTNTRTLARMEIDLSKIETKIDHDLTSLGEKIDRVMQDHETRLRSLEKWMYIAIGTGTAGVASGIASLITSGIFR